MSGTTLADRALLRLSGEDVRGFLQGLVTNDLNALGPDHPLWAGLLTAQGKALFDFILWADGDDVLVDCEASQAEALARRLTLYRLRRRIEIRREEQLAVHWSPFGLSLSKPSPSSRDEEEGKEEREALRQAQDEGEGMTAAPDPRLSPLGRRWLAPAGEAASGWLAHRLALGVTEGVEELGSDKTLWLECNAAELQGVSFAKGCYVGQENTARMNWRQKVNRRLVVVPADVPGPRTRILYPELGLAVEHRRIDDLEGALIPDWLAAALA
ncbi:MAG: folate-binding protein [Sphingomonadaceae bacterium]|nr:folate-binding protein [Sphingomonadaceae bacterium]